jgi:DNA modification methylase
MNSLTKLAVYSDDSEAWRLIEADALSLLAKLPDDCVDAIVTDPPYGLALGGAAWDRFGEGELTASEGFERWTQSWASECRRVLRPGGHLLAFGAPRTFHRLVAGVEDAGLEVRDQLLWLHAQGLPKSHRLPGGLGTTLKPAYEPILLARKPFEGRTIDNLEHHGTGALNIDATRVGEAAYWPAHVTLAHTKNCADTCKSDCPVGMIDAARSDLLPSRLFFCAKATRREREAGCEEMPRRSVALYTGKRHSPRLVRNPHPTVKPLELMRWLVRLVTPPGGLVLDPFTGSGSTGVAAVLEGRRFLGIEREPEYVDIACARLAHWAGEARESS